MVKIGVHLRQLLQN